MVNGLFQNIPVLLQILLIYIWNRMLEFASKASSGCIRGWEAGKLGAGTDNPRLE
jgi:hypothetical protein